MTTRRRSGRAEVPDDEHHIVALALAERDDLVVRRGVEAQVAQPVQRGVLAADLVEQGEVRRERAGARQGQCSAVMPPIHTPMAKPVIWPA